MRRTPSTVIRCRSVFAPHGLGKWCMVDAKIGRYPERYRKGIELAVRYEAVRVSFSRCRKSVK